MVEAQCSVQLCFPVEFKNENMVFLCNIGLLNFYGISVSPRKNIIMFFLLWLLQMEDVHMVGFMSKLLETKILQALRFKHGQVCAFVLLCIY